MSAIPPGCNFDRGAVAEISRGSKQSADPRKRDAPNVDPGGIAESCSSKRHRSQRINLVFNQESDPISCAVREKNHQVGFPECNVVDRVPCLEELPTAKIRLERLPDQPRAKAGRDM